MNKKTYTLIGSLLCLAILLFLANTFLRGYYLRLVILFAITSIVALGVNVTNGYTNIFSLGFGGTMMVAGYATALMTLPPAYKKAVLHLPLWLEQLQVAFPLALVIAGLLAVVASIILLLPAFRLEGQYFILASMGINIVMGNLAENLRGITHGDMGLRNIPAYTNIWWAYGILLLVIYAIHRLVHSRFGRGLIAISKDQQLASVMGVPVVKYKIISFAIGSFITGVGASLWVHLVLTMNPKAFSLVYVFQVVAMLAIGGIGTLSGPLIGAAILTIGTELLAPVQEGFTFLGCTVPPIFGFVNVFMALLLIVIMIFKPRGLMNGREIGSFICFSKKEGNSNGNSNIKG
ncbi:branched-chain amino acid ABC transporter permease [Aminobacterium sp. MB27-C1]|uniref:branched-chain amino acid ABC transporter permease n=1 Tax=Aminobacterium sp. MB27-C1 TaxID=3070661 RepID=UPI0027DE5CAE|nr:branched-chain amino acid ABC transporter permease [Aminobacterium sp. MB27-C1]WMI71691.1 branched-chain amino acid ABC transporter permease [Aminobacterium sp. MB27-C1]